ncbi:IS1380 family transposase [Bacteroidota bacterium]
MKIQNSTPISSFGGLNFVIEEFNRLNISSLLSKCLFTLPPQSKYSWKDILYSFWSIIFCGGDCAEDLAINLKPSLKNNPLFNISSPDRVLNRMKDLAESPKIYKTPRGRSQHIFSFNKSLNILNIKLLQKLALLNKQNNILDYDNTLLFTDKADAANTYLKRRGYCPGVGIIGNNIVYIENRNGNSDAQTLQQDTLTRMFNLLKSSGIRINEFRADSASYQLSTLHVISQNVEKFYIRARMNETLNEAIKRIDNWEEVIINKQIQYRGSVNFIPFEHIAKRNKQQHLLNTYRLVVTKEKRKDGQINLFTGEAFNYHAILTNNYEKSNNEIVLFYNQRGAIEREFDVLKNDFAWGKMPFSKIEYNTVFLLLTAICRNLYNHIIMVFSKKIDFLSSHFRIRKFIFRFICIPGKWIKTGRTQKLRVYGKLSFKT